MVSAQVIANSPRSDWAFQTASIRLATSMRLLERTLESVRVWHQKKQALRMAHVKAPNPPK